MLGVTLTPGSGVANSRLILLGETIPALAGLSADRFPR